MTRHDDTRRIRREAADIAFNRPHFGPEPHPIPNPEENTFPTTRIANYSKGLKRENNDIIVDHDAYQSLLDALDTGDPADFEKIVLDMGFGMPPAQRGNKKLTNPLAGLAFDLEGPDGHAIALLKKNATKLDDPNSYEPFPSHPLLETDETAGEMVELYWMALLRDIDFKDYSNNDLVKEASEELSNLSDFKGPKDNNGKVTPRTIFRGFAQGDLEGPYISQFLLRGNQDDVLGRDEGDGWVKYGTTSIDQKHVVAVKGKDFGTTLKAWIAIQKGENRDLDPLYKGKKGDKRKLEFFFDRNLRFIRNARDLATYVHYDALYQAYLTACLYLLRKMDFEGAKKMLNPGNPYIDLKKTDGFGTFGGPHILSLVCEVATRALKSVWYTKWFLFRRLRPEAYGGLVHLVKDPVPNINLNVQLPTDVLDSKVIKKIKKYNERQNMKFDGMPKDGTYLLPLAFPEGSPTHPSYGAGHATVAGACVTVLKFWFNEKYEFEEIYIPKENGRKLEKKVKKLTLLGELNKLAANIAIGRNMAGVHWRSDYTQSLRLGEAIAIGILQEQKITYKEMFKNSFEFTRFDGTKVSI
ncbi:MAG TPA: vanadium-dependent haloperoxidase [Nitrososphaeraceae archaeon]|nr:vanadium-dependent haloperoxidase [Nitrososphaeraceae archaeon]